MCENLTASLQMGMQGASSVMSDDFTFLKLYGMGRVFISDATIAKLHNTNLHLDIRWFVSTLHLNGAREPRAELMCR